MPRRSGQFLAASNGVDITSDSTIGGPTVEDDLDALDAVDALKAPLASPTFTGTPAAPTAAVGTSTTQLATTAFAMQAVGLVVEVASDAAAAILNTTALLYLAETTTGDKVITLTSSRPNQELKIKLAAASGGKYTLPVTGGDLTLDAANEAPIIFRNAAGDAWLVFDLGGATIV